MMTSTTGVFSPAVCQALRKAKIQDWGSGLLDMVGPAHVQERITRAILQRGMGGTFDTKPAIDKDWCRMIVELPHHRGGLGITPLPASNLAAFYSATARLVSWLGSLPQSHSAYWVRNQDLADSNTWTSSSLSSLKLVHSTLLEEYGCIEWAPPAADAADAEQQSDDDNARPLPIPPLNLLATMQARQDEEEGDAAARASLPLQRRVTAQVMKNWPQHLQVAANPPSRRAKDMLQLHCVQSVPTHAEDSALRRDMPQRNDEDEASLKKHRLSFSPAAAVWGQMGRAWVPTSRVSRTTGRAPGIVTVSDYVAFFCQYFGYTDNPVLAPIAQERCRCQRYFHDSDHIHCCNRHSANWYRAHDHMLDAFRGICQEAGYVTDVKQVMTSEGARRADIAIFGIDVLQHTDLLADATVRHDFIGAGRDGGQRHGMLRNPDRPDQILEQAAAEKIRHYRNPYRNNRAVAFLPVCMSTSGRIHAEFLRLLFFIANKQASDYFTDLGYEPAKEEFCHRRGVYFHKHRCTVGMACAQAVAIRSAPYVARRHADVPRDLPLRMANEWDRDEASERIRA